MGTPAAVEGDQVAGTCPLHLIPNPASGAPQPAPPLPFTAPITIGTCPTVLICGSPAVVVGATGFNTPPHVGLHPADPFMVPAMQQAVITQGSATVLLGGIPAAPTGSMATCCAQPVGTLTGTAATVLIGG
jgi:uncharacterized Zn-binding protein involved in type VI secretion